ncbi:MAG: hypothetical protein QXE85_00060 [Nitrososphaerota archaeon]
MSLGNLPPTPLGQKLEFGKIHVILHEISPIRDENNNIIFMVAFHITDYEEGRPIKTGVAHIFLKPPELKPEETIGLTDEEKTALWQNKLIEELKNKLKEQVEIYRRNKSVFIL